jgi:hypothetical protein
MAQKDKSQKLLIENRHTMWRHYIVVFFGQKLVEKCGILGIFYEKMVYWEYWFQKMVFWSKSRDHRGRNDASLI